MEPGRYDLVITQGATYNKALIWKDKDDNPHDLTGYHAKMQFRENFNSPPIITLTTQNNRLIITPLEGKIEIKLTPQETRELSKCKARYDLDIYTIAEDGAEWNMDCNVINE